jgi:hypothetical protein
MTERFALLPTAMPLAVTLDGPARAQCTPPPSQPAYPDMAKPRTITIPAGTSLLIRMISKVDSSKNKGWRLLSRQPGICVDN